MININVLIWCLCFLCHFGSSENVPPKVPRTRFPVSLIRNKAIGNNVQNETVKSPMDVVPPRPEHSVVPSDVKPPEILMQGFRNSKSIRNGGARGPSVAEYGAGVTGSTLVTVSTTKPTPSFQRPTVKPTESAMVTSAIPQIVPVTSPAIVTLPTTTPPPPFLLPTALPTEVNNGSTPLITDDDDEDARVVSVGRMGLPALSSNLPIKSSEKVGLAARKSVVSNTAATDRMGSLASSRYGSRGMKYEDDANVVTDFVFSDIKCLRTKHREFFGASIYMKKGYHVPYIRDRPQDPLTSAECKMERLETPNGYRMAVTDLRGCGVEQCGDSLCLTVVFPRVPTLALADDEVTTIKCQPQKSSISETRTISFAGDAIPSLRLRTSRESRRSSSTVEGGGQDFAAEVGVFRQNPGTSNGLFVKRVNSGGVVQLGEPLQLRSVVRGGDGWSHSKLSDVKVWRMSDNFGTPLDKLNPNDASEVITLVDADGCRNPEYDVIAEAHPLRDPRNNLVHHFTFRAFLFRGQRANEPLIITAKVMACQEAGECRFNECGSSRSPDPNVSRYKRSSPGMDPNFSRYKRSPVEVHNASSIIQGFDTQLALRVVGLQDHPSTLSENDLADPGLLSQEMGSFTCTEKMGFAAAGGSCVTLFLLGLVVSLIFYHVKNKESDEEMTAQNDGNGGTKNSAMFATPSPLEYVRKPVPNKPLPPTPVEYDQVAIDNDVVPTRSLSEIKSEMKMNAMTCEYESISERKKAKSASSKDDGVVIVYCCDKKRKHGSNSAPSSLRSKRRQREKIERLQDRFRQMEDDTEESDGFYSTDKCIRTPRTVREVKRNNNKHRRISIRRRLSSFYREMNGGRSHRSFPARISVKNIQGGTRRGKVYYTNDGDNCDYSDGLSPGSSDIDSAYAGSECSKHRDRRSCGETCRRTSEGKTTSPVEKPGMTTHFRPQPPEQEIYGHLGEPPTSRSTHFVSTNETSTKIIILPETNV